jgi:hypothetical protein
MSHSRVLKDQVIHNQGSPSINEVAQNEELEHAEDADPVGDCDSDGATSDEVNDTDAVAPWEGSDSELATPESGEDSNSATPTPEPAPIQLHTGLSFPMADTDIANGDTEPEDRSFEDEALNGTLTAHETPVLSTGPLLSATHTEAQAVNSSEKEVRSLRAGPILHTGLSFSIADTDLGEVDDVIDAEERERPSGDAIGSLRRKSENAHQVQKGRINRSRRAHEHREIMGDE